MGKAGSSKDDDSNDTWPGMGRDAASGQINLVDVAPAPVFTRFERLDHRMVGRVKVLRRVFVFGAIATADMTAGEAPAQMKPLVAHCETFLAPVGRLRRRIARRFDVRADLLHVLPYRS
jgi:hypothetical protein